MAPVGPWAQPKATRREGGRRAERPAGSYATPDTPCSRTAPTGLPQTEARDAQRGGPPLESPCRVLSLVLSLVLSFASKESTTPSGRQPHHSRRSRRVKPPLGKSIHSKFFALRSVPAGTTEVFRHSLPPFHSKHAIELLISFRTSRNASRPTHKTSQNFLPLSNQKKQGAPRFP